jgi:hypothetical protein
VQQSGVARLACTGKPETEPNGSEFKNQPLSVQQIATQEVRNCARNGRFERFVQSAIVAFVHAALGRVWGVVAQVLKWIRKPLLYPFELREHTPKTGWL